jgi:pimeloyl-ACP methyl ester carboxylesterase
VAFFSAAREIYLDEPFGQKGFWDRLATLRRPALFLWGDRDVMVPHGFARHVEMAVPNAQSIVLADCGHVPQFENPQLLHRLIREFLATR